MLDLNDFFHLPEVDGLVEQVVAAPPGLIVVAGLDPRPGAAAIAPGTFLPSGRSTVFGIIARRLLATDPEGLAVVVADSKDAVRLPNSARGRTRLALTRPPDSYRDQLIGAIAENPAYLILDALDAGTAPLAFQAAVRGARVLAQLDGVFCGASLAQHLHDIGVTGGELVALRWVVTVQRVPTLCDQCRQPVEAGSDDIAVLRGRYPGLPPDGPFYRRGEGCPACGGSGVAGDVAAFDFFQASEPVPGLFNQASVLSMEEYMLHLALAGQVALPDVLEFETGRVRRTYLLLSASEQALGAANQELRQKLAELESANRVLRQRTESLMSLEQVARALIGSDGLDDLARSISRHVRQLCGADRAILYLLRPDLTAEVLAVDGWDPSILHTRLDAADVFGTSSAGGRVRGKTGGPEPFNAWPPGTQARHPDLAGAALRAGLRVPLIAQHEMVGLMIVHSTRKAKFSTGETALLQAYADQAALAIQRAGLIESLQDKITRLEEAQADLVRKQRLERELELARQVQQSILPRVFPDVPGLSFAAHNQPARQVGGDFYDIFRLDEDHYGLAIADVSDKGMPAALFMALTRSLLLAEARREPSPRRVLEQVHSLLLELGDPQMFVTVFYGVIETVSCTLTYTRAGHERPLLLRDGTARPLGGRGTFLGNLAPDVLDLTQERIELKPGDRLVLYTDGLVDALNPEDQPFGDARLAEFLAAHAGMSPQALCQSTFAELTAFQAQADQFDDMALVVVGIDPS